MRAPVFPLVFALAALSAVSAGSYASPPRTVWPDARAGVLTVAQAAPSLQVAPLVVRTGSVAGNVDLYVVPQFTQTTGLVFAVPCPFPSTGTLGLTRGRSSFLPVAGTMYSVRPFWTAGLIGDFPICFTNGSLGPVLAVTVLRLVP